LKFQVAAATIWQSLGHWDQGGGVRLYILAATMFTKRNLFFKRMYRKFLSHADLQNALPEVGESERPALTDLPSN
jgi:hypothetical protein